MAKMPHRFRMAKDDCGVKSRLMENSSPNFKELTCKFVLEKV